MPKKPFVLKKTGQIKSLFKKSSEFHKAASGDAALIHAFANSGKKFAAVSPAPCSPETKQLGINRSAQAVVNIDYVLQTEKDAKELIPWGTMTKEEKQGHATHFNTGGPAAPDGLGYGNCGIVWKGDLKADDYAKGKTRGDLWAIIRANYK